MLKTIKEKMNLKNIENIKEIYHKINFVIEFLFSIILGYAILKMIYVSNYCGFISKPYLAVIIITSIIILANMIINIYVYRKKLEKLWLTFVIPIGIIFLMFVLPNHVPDENAHIYRAYDMSKGNIIVKVDSETNKNSYIPKQMTEEILRSDSTYLMLMQNLEKKTDYNDEVKTFNGAQAYSPTLYIAPAIMFFISRFLDINIIVGIYLARLSNFIIFLLGGYFAIKKIPYGKLLLATYCFSPMCLQQAISVSADSIINTTAILFIAFTLYLAFKDKIITKAEKIIYVILGILLAVAKFVYIPILFISLIILRNKKQENKDKYKLIATTIIAGIILAVIWYIISMQYVDIRTYIIENGINTVEQIKYILSNPIEYLKTLKNTFHDQGEFYIYSFIGNYLCQFTVTVPNLTILAYIILLILSPFFEEHKYSINKKEKIWSVFLTLATIILVMTALYLTWTPIGASVIEGVQGRYFFPCMIVLLICLCMKNNYIKLKYVTQLYPIILLLLNCSAIQFIIQRYI